MKDKYDNLNIPVRYAAWMQDSLEDYIHCHEPDVLVTMFDIWPQECSYIPDVVRRTRVPWVHHITINSKPFSPYLAERIQEAKVVINPSKFSYRMMEEAGYQKIAYIPHGVDTNIYKPLPIEEKQEIKKKLDIENKFVFLCVNRNKGMQKALWILFRAYKKFLYNVKDAKKNTVLLFCCDPLEPEPGNHNMIALRASMNMTENVKFIKAKPNKEWTKVEMAKEDDPKAFYHHANYGFEEDEMRKIFGIADVHCITSEGESFSLPVIEACACGIPNIFPNHTTGPELIGKPKTGLLTKILMEHATPMLSDVAITDENDVAEKMILLYQDSKLWDELSKNALEFANDYSWDKIIDKWDKLLRAVPYLA